MPASRRAVLAGLAATAVAGVPRALAVPPRFIGLSYEIGELVEGTRLSPQNRALVALLRRLGSEGLLRLGGNSSDRARAHPTIAAIERLAGFLRATGWSLLYGLDCGNGTPRQAADEAHAVADAAGPALLAFQIGNEPDLFAPKLRPRGWNVAEYLDEWRRFAETVLRRVPGARFAGPDIAENGSWIMPFAALRDPRPVLLTRHFYTEGPGSSPSVTIARMLGSTDKLAAAMRPAERAARASGLPVRMAEANSVYDGGRPGVSNTLAAAAWGAELMFRLAAAGWNGVNFHTRPDCSYAPLGEQTAGRPIARPLYYGMLLFAQSRPCRVSVLPVRNAPAVSAYAIEGRDQRRRFAFINMSPREPAHIALPGIAATRLIRLAAASPAATSGVTLGGAEVANDGAWRPAFEPADARGGFDLPPGNAVLVW
ncbi:MAG TPA: glycosyl hydrolase family 79 C-terminal domain-containing protein [Stellaceae bacterium]|nr:glycosyl hydrolase family 79 C-terminal domain-containing protein [Stellaceae bacterium]